MHEHSLRGAATTEAILSEGLAMYHPEQILFRCNQDPSGCFLGQVYWTHEAPRKNIEGKRGELWAKCCSQAFNQWNANTDITRRGRQRQSLHVPLNNINTRNAIPCFILEASLKFFCPSNHLDEFCNLVILVGWFLLLTMKLILCNDQLRGAVAWKFARLLMLNHFSPMFSPDVIVCIVTLSGYPQVNDKAIIKCASSF